MNPFNGPIDDMEECFCDNCKSRWWVPYYEEIPDLGHPSYCCFCGLQFGWIMEME